MISLLNYIRKDRIFALNARRRDDILKALVESCLRDVESAKQAELMDRLLRRGYLKDQAVGLGFAFAHARADDVPDIVVSVGLLAEDARFRGREPIHTVFCTVIPADKSSQYLSFIARLSRFLMQPGIVEAFKSRDPDRIIKMIEAFET